MKAKRKISEYEYWPMWVFYAPFVPYWLMRSIQSGSTTYFCKANSGMEFGGFLDYSKFKVIEQIPENFKPKSIFISKKNSTTSLLPFPFVAKPNFGERGVNVEIIRNESDWEKYPLQEDIILQEFIDLPYEFGVFYVQNPETKEGQILSITGKEFLVYEADGNSTLKEFVSQHPRAISRLEYLQSKFQKDWDIVYPKGTKILLEPIGNHNRGTKFYNASHLVSKDLTQKIHEVALKIEGFHYGRLDVKAESEESLKKGEFKILEINGANSEATHIYDPNFKLVEAYKEAKRHFDWQYKIAQNQPKHHSSKEFYKAVLKRIFS